MRYTLLALLLCCSATLAAEPRIDPNGLRGSLVIVGGGSLPEIIHKQFLELAGGKERAKLIVIPTASNRADNAKPADITKTFDGWGFKDVTVLHTRDRAVADSAEFVKPLKMATAVWINGGSQSLLAEAYQGTAVERELQSLLNRDGVIGGTSAGAAIMSQVMIAQGNPTPVIKTGLDLLPDAIIDQHFTERKRQPRLRTAVKEHPATVGFGIDEGTALVVGPKLSQLSRTNQRRYGNDNLVRGRTLHVIGKGRVTVMLAASGNRQATEMRVSAGTVFDLTTLRKSARERAGADFPPRKLDTPNVPHGSLVIVGGGGMPEEITKRIIELAGGPDAKIVVLPTAVPDRYARRVKPPRYFTRAGAKNVTVMPHSRWDEVNSKEFLDVIRNADCLWFGGGRQWRFVDAYAGSPAVAAFHDMLRRGGVIAGSSAGASIQGDYLARAHPLGNLPIMAEGYERGFKFLPGTAIDQHFRQRKRFKDMTQLMRTHPQFLGIGLDEATAIVVRGRVAEVLGQGQAHFYDRRKPVSKRGPDYESLSRTGRYDLTTRKVLQWGQPAVAERRAG